MLREALLKYDQASLKKLALILRHDYPQLSSLLLAIATCTKEELEENHPGALAQAMVLTDIYFSNKDLQ